MHPAMTYVANRNTQRFAAMVAGAAITMPRHEAAPRCSAALQAIGTAAEAKTAMASAVAETTAAVATAATSGAGGATSITETMMRQIAIQAGKLAATAIASQLAHAACPTRRKADKEDRGNGANHYLTNVQCGLTPGPPPQEGGGAEQLSPENMIL